MILSILSTTPTNATNDVAIDSKISLVFNQQIDSFTIDKGLSLYILDENRDYVFVPFTYEIDGNQLTLSPTLIPDKKHYLTVLPGNDVDRYLSAETVSDPIYTRSGTSTGIFKALSSFSGIANITYTLSIGLGNTVSITKGLTFLDTITYIPGEPIVLDDISFSLEGQFDEGDDITVNCFKAAGVDSIYKIEFSTTKYITLTPGSIDIDYVSGIEDNSALYIVDTIPENLSVDNIRCNPIVLKFNRPLDETQDIKSKIKITKTGLTDGKKRYIDYDYKVTGNIVRLYLKSVGNPILT